MHSIESQLRKQRQLREDTHGQSLTTKCAYIEKSARSRCSWSLGAISEDMWEYYYALVDSGMMITEGNIVQYGKEGRLFPASTNAANPPNEECFRKTVKHFDLCYSLIETKVKSWKACINMGRAVIFGFIIYQSFNDFAVDVSEKRKGQDFIAPIPKTGEKDQGGHAVLAVGWDDHVPTKDGGTTGCFLIQNSWGSNWGENGFCWIPFEWLTVKGLIISSVAMVDPQTTGS